MLNPRTGQVRSFHRFAPALPRLVTPDGVCDTCETHVPGHAGPVVPRTYAFPLREVAAAFVAVGTGASYLQAADRARVAAGRARLPGDRGGALVAEWLDRLAPAVLEPAVEEGWPETLILDSTRFMTVNVRTGTPSVAFNVLGAYGYPAEGRPRVWALHAAHHAQAHDWERFLRSLDVTHPPRLVIADGADEIRTAVRAVWPAHPSPSYPVPFVARCEHHLRLNIVGALKDDRVDHFGSRRMTTLNDAFRSVDGWDAFTRTVTPKQAAATAWLTANADMVAAQVAVRHLGPAHYSTAALDQCLGRVRDVLASRSFVLRNQDRTNLMLGLVRNHLNGVDLECLYLTQLRNHLSDPDGTRRSQRSGYDREAGPRTPGAERAVASLRR